MLRPLLLAVLVLTVGVSGPRAQEAAAGGSFVGFEKAFAPAAIGPGSVSTLTLELDNQGPVRVTDLAFIDALPAGVTIATPAAASTTCVGAERDGSGAVLSAPNGGTTITFSGGVLPAGASCRVVVNVTSATAGTHTNTTGDLTSSVGNSGTATADLTVNAGLPGFVKSFAPATVGIGGRSTLTLTIDNSVNGRPVSSLAFDDVFPAGMVVASPANASTTCGTEPLAPTLTAEAGAGQIALTYLGTLSYPGVGSGETCTVTVDVEATRGGVLANVSGDLSADGVMAGKASAVLTVREAGTIAFTKDFVDDPVPAGGPVALRFTIRNLDRDNAATSIAFTDDLGAALAGLAATGVSDPDPACGAGSALTGTTVLSLTGGSLAPGGSCTFEVPLLVPSSAATGSYENTTSALTADLGGVGFVGDPAVSTLFVAPVPELAKAFTDDPVAAGNQVTLEYTVTNTSQTDGASDLTFQDELTAFLPFPLSVSGTESAFCGRGSTVSVVSMGSERQAIQLSGGNIPTPGGSCTIIVGVTVPAGFPAGTYASTTSAITGTVGAAAVTGPPATDDLVVDSGPTLSKAFDRPLALRGETVRLEFTLSHDFAASGDATDIAFTDDLGAALSGLARPSGAPALMVCGGTLSGESVLTFSGGALARDSECAFAVDVVVPADASYGVVTNATSAVTATVSGQTLTSPAAMGTLNVTPLRLLSAFIGRALPGQTATLRYGITNRDVASAASGLTFTQNLDLVLDDLVPVAPAPTDPCGAGSSVFFSGSVVILSGGTLDPGGACSFDVTVAVPAGATPGTYDLPPTTLNGTVGGTPVQTTGGGEGPLRVESGAPVFSKAFSPSTILTGLVSRLTFTIDNTGVDVPATGFEFTDTFPSGLVVAPVSNQSTTCASGMLGASPGGGSVSFAGGEVPARSRCTISLDVTAGAAGVYDNVSGDLTSSLGNSGPAAATLTVVDPQIYATKAAAFETDGDSDGEIDANDVLRYTVTVFNRTAGPLPGLSFTDTPDSNTRLVDGSVTTSQGTVTPGSGSAVGVSLGTLAAGAFATVTYDVVAADPLPESVGRVCNQGFVRDDTQTVPTDDKATDPFNDPTCVTADRPTIDLVLTVPSTPTRGEALELVTTEENTTDAPVHYKRRLVLVHPDGRRERFSADRNRLVAGETTSPSVLPPAPVLPSDAPAGTYTAEVQVTIVGTLELVDVEEHTFTLPPLMGGAMADLTTVRPSAGPNPFLQRTLLRFPVLEAAAVDLRVFDVTGREVAVLVDGRLPRGLHEATFDGAGRPAGVYLWRLTVDGEVTTGAVTLVR